MSPHLNLTAPYAPLVRRIEAEGSVDGQILRIDHFLNHRIEPAFIFELAHELAKRLSFFQPNLILTAEASGIAPALIVAQTLSVPMVYAKKYSRQVEAPALSRLIHSPTKGDDNRLVISGRYIKPGQRVVIVDPADAMNVFTANALLKLLEELLLLLVIALAHGLGELLQGFLLLLVHETMSIEVIHLRSTCTLERLARESKLLGRILGSVTLGTCELEQAVVWLRSHHVVLNLHHLTLSCTHQGSSMVTIAELLALLAALL